MRLRTTTGSKLTTTDHGESGNDGENDIKDKQMATKMMDKTNGWDVDNGEVNRDRKRTAKMTAKTDEEIFFRHLLHRHLCRYSPLWSVVVSVWPHFGPLWFIVVISHTKEMLIDFSVSE